MARALGLLPSLKGCRPLAGNDQLLCADQFSKATVERGTWCLEFALNLTGRHPLWKAGYKFNQGLVG